MPLSDQMPREIAENCNINIIGQRKNANGIVGEMEGKWRRRGANGGRLMGKID
jgi:hypothetical protein